MPATSGLPAILLTGFEPFDRDRVNPSWEVARALDGEVIAGHRVHARQLACVFGRSVAQLHEALVQVRPRLVLCLGLAGGRSELTPERVAVNNDDARIPDNAGRQPVDVPVIEAAGAPAAYFSSLPIKAIVRELRAARVPASVSNTAGSFVCNHVFYALMHWLATEPGWQTVRGGFMHVPALPEQAVRQPGMPSMALATQIDGVRRALASAATVQDDVREVGGRLH